MISYDEGDGVLTIKRETSNKFTMLMAGIGLFIIATDVLLVWIKLNSPATISVDCDRARGTCVVSPVSAGWKPQTLTIEELRTVHIEGKYGKRILYAGSHKPGTGKRIQLSETTGKIGDLKAAQTKLLAFPDSKDAVLKVSYTGESKRIVWYQIIVGLLFGIACLRPAFRFIRFVEITFDRNQDVVIANIHKLVGGQRERTFPLHDIQGIQYRTMGWMLSLRLTIQGGNALDIVGEVQGGRGSRTDHEGKELATKLSAFLTIPINGS
jgi:hypothetical protein